MKRLLKKLESLAKISFLQVKDARAIYGQVSTAQDTSHSYDTSLSYDTSQYSTDYCVIHDYNNA